MWTKETVDQLNEYQKNQFVHPYTCGTPDCGIWKDCLNWEGKPHKVFFRSVLIATENGWICDKCDYTQNWFIGSIHD